MSPDTHETVQPPDDEFQRFTDSSTRAINFAREEARRRQEVVVGTEHLLVGLVEEALGMAAHVLHCQGVTLTRVRAELSRLRETTPAHTAPISRLTLSPCAKRTLKHTLHEAQVRDGDVNTEHLLLGLLDAGETASGYRLLQAMGVNIEQLRQETRKITAPKDAAEPSTPHSTEGTSENEPVEKPRKRVVEIVIMLAFIIILYCLFVLRHR